jgi:hypothetical protein
MIVIVFILFPLVVMRWIRDGLWIISGALGITAAKGKAFDTYLAELEDKVCARSRANLDL